MCGEKESEQKKRGRFLFHLRFLCFFFEENARFRVALWMHALVVVTVPDAHIWWLENFYYSSSSTLLTKVSSLQLLEGSP